MRRSQYTSCPPANDKAKWSASLSWVVTDVHYWDHPGDRGEMTSVTESGRDSSNDLGNIRTHNTTSERFPNSWNFRKSLCCGCAGEQSSIQEGGCLVRFNYTKGNTMFSAILKSFCSVNSQVWKEDRCLAEGLVSFSSPMRSCSKVNSDFYETVSLPKTLPTLFTFLSSGSSNKIR